MSADAQEPGFHRSLYTISSILRSGFKDQGLDRSQKTTPDDNGEQYLFPGNMLGCMKDPADNKFCAEKPLHDASQRFVGNEMVEVLVLTRRAWIY